MALGLTQSLTDMSKRGVGVGWGWGVRGVEGFWDLKN